MVKKNDNFLTGYVGIAGRPNVGKSSLMNRIIGEPVSIVTRKKQTTRSPVLGILSSQDYQIAFIDNPGIDFKNKLLLNKRLKKIAFSNVIYTSANVVVLEAKTLFSDDLKILSNMPEDVPLIIALNKIDKIKSVSDKEAMYKIVPELEKFKPVNILPISVKKSYQLELLVKIIKTYLPVGEPLFENTLITDQNLYFRISEIIRKNIINCVGDELHYNIAVEVTKLQKGYARSSCTIIEATIFTSKLSHKPMIIGEGGRKLKAIRLRSTKELKIILGTNIHLSLWVKLMTCWNKNPSFLNHMGIT